MGGLSWGELVIVGVVALIVVGPKDLPVLFRNVGQFVGKARGMAREFTRAMNDAADETGVKDMAKGFKAATDPLDTAMKGVKEAASSMTDFNVGLDDPLDNSGSASDKAKPGGATAALSAERQEAKDKIAAKTAEVAQARLDKEAADAAAQASQPTEAKPVAEAPAKSDKESEA